MDPPRFFDENRKKVSRALNKTHEFLCLCVTLLISTGTVWRLFHVRPARQEDDSLPRHTRQRLHPERQDPRRLRRRNLHRPHNPRVRQGRRLRLPERQAHGAEEGWLRCGV